MHDAPPSPRPTPLCELDAAPVAALLRDPQVSRRPLLVDVREDHEWAAGHLPGALHVPLARLEADPAAVLTAVGDRPTVLYCRAGVRSQRALEALASAGARGPLHNLAGGILAWQAAGQTVICDP